jgi:hypothetical protein
MRVIVPALVLAAGTIGCSAHGEPEYDGKVPGKLLGTFAVTGKLGADDCGAELLNAPDPWRFEVRLSRFENDLYWLNGREAIVGELGAKAKTFEFGTRVDVPVSSAKRGAPGCTVSRYDYADGSLAWDGDDLLGLSGRMRFEYRTKTDTECLEIIGVPGGFNNLPCELSYAIEAKRSKAP